MPARRLNTFQRVVLMLALAVGAGLSIAPPWEGLRPTGGGNLSRELEPIGHYPVFSPPHPREPLLPSEKMKRQAEERERQKRLDIERRAGIDPTPESPGNSPDELEAGVPWRGIRVAWVRVGLEFAALVFVTLLLLVMGQLFRGNETHPSRPAEGA